MVTGSHGVRMQYDYTDDIAGLAGTVSATSPRWLRLTRAGDTVTGYESADGTHWTGSAPSTLAGLPATVQAGLFVASPATHGHQQLVGGGSAVGGPALATGAFDQLTPAGQLAGGRWHRRGAPRRDRHGAAVPRRGGFTAVRRHGFTVTGSGDIAPGRRRRPDTDRAAPSSARSSG